ncbi:LPXTG cell wall anchor domain-containing protein [Gemmiger formicilis]|uniref:LPXTG cell wall anchor domain-containing protein n=1 Tax=Gemmiger formicilis TaxID=745368 RepID=UPI00351F9A2E
MAALMFFQCTAPVAFAADDAILAESSIAVSSADSESVPADSDAGYIPEKSPENTSVDSSSNDAASSEPLTGDSSASSDLPEDASSNGSVESQPESDTDQISTSDEIIDSELAESSSENTDESAKSLYQDGKILIYTYDQLAEIGSGQTLTDASGLAVTDENGAEITYALDAQYAIAEDIELTDDMLQWQLPEGFAGSITPLAESSDDLTLYDAQSDTIYLYNPYQMTVLHGENPDTEPVMDGDAQAETFGSGQLIYPNGESEPYLTYSLNHRYILSRQFCSDTSVQPYSVVTDGKADGRDFPGQVIKELNGKTYILIGNEQQLRAIGTDAVVYGAIYQAYLRLGKWYVDNGTDGKPIVLYGGDADLTKDQNGRADFTFGEIRDTDKNLSVESGIYTRGKCGVDQKTGQPNPNLDIKDQTKQKYSANANYIIFRDIDLSSANWTPLTFRGTMIGAKLGGNAATDARLWENGQIIATDKPVISNVKVVQSGPLDVGKQMGVGFFSTLYDEASEDDVGISKGQVLVSNLRFENISVDNQSTTTKYDQTLVNGLVTGLSQVLGSVVDLLAWLLTFGSVDAGLRKTLTDVLDARKKDPTALATGAFAGRIIGNTVVSNCELAGNVSVTSPNNYTAGFVGYIEGKTQYDGLSKALGGVATLLANILNVIPGLGLGDLITILLGGVIDVSKLIPTAYINAKIVNCHVEGLKSTIGTESKDFAGGFAGMQAGAIIENCTVTNSSLNVVGKNFVGGFVGLSRDSTIKGVLKDLGVVVNNLPNMKPESLLLNCRLDNTSIKVNGASYAGGFAGGLANSSTVNCSATAGESLAVHATGMNAGGFAGIATLGWAANLGKTDSKDSDLLGSVVSLVEGLLSQNPGEVSSLLSLAGVNPSYILGCTINAPLTVTGTDFVGGITGRGDGVTIAPSNAENLGKISYWKRGVYKAEETAAQPVSVTGLKIISGHDYTGGIAGSLGTASVSGLLNDTAGIASYLGFTVDSVTLTGYESGFTVEGWERVGGGFGDAIGGTINNVSINKLRSVEGKNYAGGFIGLSGPGELVGTSGGLTVNLLGLNYLLTLNKLLSIGQYVQVTIKDANVNGIDKDGFTVEATEKREANSVLDYTAAGFIARSNSTKIENSHVTNLKSVTAANDGGYAAGFVAISKTGGLAEVGEDSTQVKSLIEANGLVTAISYLIPSYTNCTVSYVNGGSVTGDVAGGFTADFQSGTVDNSSREANDFYAVYNLDVVNGQSYAGGFAGRAYSGALADASKGISILGGLTGVNINLSDLLSVINAYVPYIQYAGVKSDNGFTVTATKLTEDTTVGSAGGFVGYASGAQISYSDVTKLKHTIVTPPDDLEDTSAPTYYDNAKSTYAVTGGRYAGGYVGDMDIGSAASVGGGLNILGKSIELTGLLDALSVVVTTIEHSDVTGGTGGYAVLATGDLGNSKGKVGMAGGYAGGMYGGHIQDSQAVNFSYIIGEIAAGGYVGEMQPGDVAKLLDNASILSKLVNVDTALASVLQSFVPSIRNSSTNCVPCGGAVRANAASDTTVQRGMAGGFVGHNMGGTIHGFDTSLWKKEYDKDDTSKAYNGPMSLCKAERIRSVYGHEYAGGYTGLMEPADTAKVGGLKVLGGLISVNNILGALGVIYPVQTNTAVYGPLAGLDVDTWNNWVEYVGKYGGYGYELAKAGTVNTQEELEAKLADYIYGYNVVAGRGQFDSQLYGGDAGGYVGCMNSGTLTNCMAYDAKQISAMHSAGGFAGQMKTGGAVELGTVNILGLKLNAGQLLNIAQLFVPAVRNSSVQGYKSGLTVQATGLPENHCGYSGGFVGSAYGAQIQLNGEEKLPTTDQWSSTDKYAAPVASCNATNLRRVTGRIAVGGYVGLASAGSVAGVNTNASNGLLQGILDHLIATPGDLATVLKATATTIHAAKVSAADSQWGFVVDGAYKEGDSVKYAAYAGGFAGSLEASAVGEKDSAIGKIQVENLRSVDGGKYAGGFFGLADVAGVAQVSGKDPKGSETKLLSGLIKLGNTSVLDAFRTYIYDSKVTGVQSGLTVQAHSGSQEATQSETRYTGCAGGFGGGMMDGSVKNSAVSNLANVEGLNYTGGFIGHLGKSGVADIDDVNVLDKLLGGTVGALDLFGSHVDNCSVTGFGLGTVIKAQGGQQPIAGGFAGYADLAKISSCSTNLLKKVTSGQIAGGFIGKTDMNYVVSAELQSRLLNTVFVIVDKLLGFLYIGKLQDVGFIDINLGPILKLAVLSEGNTLSVTLLGLKISVALNKATEPGQSDLAIITIGDSVIELPCTQNGIDKDKIPNVKINLIKGNRTDIDSCTVSGISSGYDVYAGGADDTTDGSNNSGYSGGFIGLNHEGQVKNSTMTLCDVVRGTKNLVGPFTGVNDLKSVYSFNTIKSIEGNNNHYSIYRAYNALLAKVAKANKDVFGSAEKDTSTGTDYNRYEVLHLDKITEFSDLKDAKMEDAAAATTADLAAYASPAKAVLMLDTANTDNPDSTITEPADTADPCKKYVDLTISKIWKDFANIDGKRPNEIKVNIYQQEFKPDGTAAGDKTLYKTIIMTKDDVESGHASTWRTVLKNAPVLKYQTTADGTVTDTIEAYYVYSFEEETVPGYTLTGSTYDEKTYHATITNTHHPMLPDTGSTGDWLYVVVGVGILLLALSVPRKRKGRREAH